VLKETYGVIVYQEQVMQIAQILAGYSLGEADLLRRAMGKKKKEEMDQQKARFVSGATELGVPEHQSDSIFELVAKFAGYGFNKSHAAAYAVLTYQTAWVKTHYPEDFYAASMAFDLGNTDKLAIFVDDMRRMGVACLPPCINASGSDFTVEPLEEGLAVRFALGALKGVGEGAMEMLCAERREKGAFAALDDLANRINPRLLNKRQIESLAGSGALDALNDNRAGCFAVAETVLAVASQAEHGRTSGQGGLFGEGEASVVAIQLPGSAKWSMAERMAAEKEAFGFYFSAHPVDRYRHVAGAHGARSFVALSGAGGEGRTSATMAALVEDARWRTSKKGNRFLSATLSDESGQFQANCFDDDACVALEELGRNGGCVLLKVELERQPGEETPRVTVRGAQRLDALAGSARLNAIVSVDGVEAVAALAELLANARGGRCELVLHALLPAGQTAHIRLGRDFLIDGELAAMMGRLPGVIDVELKAQEAPRLALVG
jgi:DNA polymerase-3 subunit alpha